MSAAIEILGVSKKYFRGVHHTHTRLLSGAISQWGKRLLGRKVDDGYSIVDEEPFWALQDISLSIEQGDVVGIVGRNGSGKSTLLKIISRITAPTDGEIRLNGRTGTLLEVGTGFHPELSGRENVYLNGAILGMTRAEIARKFDEIVDFSGVEAFIDTPVKRYSSGMQTRLAFSVAAHLEPEILIIDEVLAVGDAEFQKKCLGKMDEVAKGGRTVLFVSHNMSAVEQLCNRAIWLDSGKLVLDTRDIYEAATRYFQSGESPAERGEVTDENAPPLENEFFALKSFRLCNAAGETVNGPVPANLPVSVEMRLEVKKTHSSLSLGYSVTNEAGDPIFWSMFNDQDDTIVSQLKVGEAVVTSLLPPRFLNQGRYNFHFLGSLHNIGWLAAPGQTPYSVALRIEGGMSDSMFWRQHRPGVVAPVLPWTVLVRDHATLAP
jgi:lipopolysaccharide transport system ATP-binding protein